MMAVAYDTVAVTTTQYAQHLNLAYREIGEERLVFYSLFFSFREQR
jgi:hypothetical protein